MPAARACGVGVASALWAYRRRRMLRIRYANAYRVHVRGTGGVRHLPLNKIPAVVEGSLVFRRDIGLTAGILFLGAPLSGSVT